MWLHHQHTLEENLLDGKPSEKMMSIVLYVVLQLPLLLLANFNSS